MALSLLATAPAVAQQQVMFTQYMFNGLALNPAYAGSHETVSVTGIWREQWGGIEGAPSTQTFSVHSPISHKKIGLGLVLLHDNIGVTSQTGVYGSYAYRIKTKKGKLAFGLQAGFSSYSVDNLSLDLIDNPAFDHNVSEAQPNIGVGVYYSTKKFYVGASAPQLLETTFDRDNPDSDSKLVRHYFATLGYVLELNRNFKLKPNLLVKAVAGAPVEVDLNANLLIRDVLWVGVSYRSFDSIDAILQMQLTNRLQLGYAYDFITTTDLGRVNRGSHELSLNYLFSFNKVNIITPRYF